MEEFSQRLKQDTDDLRLLTTEFCQQFEVLRDDILEELEEAEWRWHHVENRLREIWRAQPRRSRR